MLPQILGQNVLRDSQVLWKHKIPKAGSTPDQRAGGAGSQIYATQKAPARSRMAALCAHKKYFGYRVIKEQNLAQYINQLLTIVLPPEEMQQRKVPQIGNHCFVRHSLNLLWLENLQG